MPLSGTLIIAGLGIAVLLCAVVHVVLRKVWERRLETLERDLHHFSEEMLEMAEIQMKNYDKLSADLEQMEARMLDFSAPTSGRSLPLERRHQVLTLARQGISAEDIVKRLNVPRGEAELILNLRKYLDADVPRTSKAMGDVDRYAQA